MAQDGGVVEHDHGAGERHGRQVRRADQHAGVARAHGQHRLLPRVPRAVRERARRAQHAVVAERGQPRGQLARPALHAAELGARGGARVDRVHAHIMVAYGFMVPMRSRSDAE